MKKKVFFVLKIVFLVLIILSLNGLFSWHNDKKEVERIMDTDKDLLEEHKTNDGEIVYTLNEEAKYRNDDTVGWLIVEGTNINYPVVQRDNNNYYLNHNYLGDKSNAGWIFMDSDNKLTDQNIIIYGHHRKDGIMFGDIDKLMKEKFYKNHTGEITLVVGNENRVYQIFSVYKAEANSNYNQPNYEDFPKMLEEFKKRSSINFDSDLDDVKQIITLSTCHDNNKDRLVVQAYRIK